MGELGGDRLITIYTQNNPTGTEIKRQQAEPFDPRQHTAMWIDVVTPNDEDFKQLQKLYQIHDADIDYYRMHHDRPRLAIHHTYISFTLHFLQGNLEQFTKDRVWFILNKTMLITVREQPINAFHYVFNMIEEENLLKNGVEFALYKLLARMLFNYGSLIEGLERKVDKTNNAIDEDKNILPWIREIRRHSSRLLKILEPERRALQLLGTHDFPYTTDYTEAYFADLSDHLEEQIADLEGARDSLNETIEAYTAIQSNDMNKIMKTLTIISTIFLPATLIASVYGMNFKIPEYNWKYGYVYSLGFMATLAVMILVIMKKRGWF